MSQQTPKEQFDKADFAAQVELALRTQREIRDLEKKLQKKKDLLSHALKNSHIGNVLGVVKKLSKKTKRDERPDSAESTTQVSRKSKKQKVSDDSMEVEQEVEQKPASRYVPQTYSGEVGSRNPGPAALIGHLKKSASSIGEKLQKK